MRRKTIFTGEVDNWELLTIAQREREQGSVVVSGQEIEEQLSGINFKGQIVEVRGGTMSDCEFRAAQTALLNGAHEIQINIARSRISSDDYFDGVNMAAREQEFNRVFGKMKRTNRT